MNASNDLLATLAAEARGAVINVVCKPSVSTEIVQKDAKCAKSAKDGKRAASDKERQYAVLIEQYGLPLTYGEKGQLYWNEAFFAGKFATENELLFSPEENRFYSWERTCVATS